MISNSGSVICSPRDPQISTLPNSTMRCCDLMTSLRNAWFGHTAWICPLVVLHERREQPEARPARVREAGVQHVAADRRGHARPQRDDRLHAAAILVAARKAKQQVFDGVEAGLLEIRGLARTDALQELQGHLQDVVCHQLLMDGRSGLASTSMRWILAGSSKVSSIDEPFGIVGGAREEVHHLREERLRNRHAAHFGASRARTCPCRPTVTMRPDAVTGSLPVR